MIKWNGKKHGIFSFLTFEYHPLDEDYLRREQFSEEEIKDLKKGMEMEEDGWGFLEYQNNIVFGDKKKEILDRTYFIVKPNKQIIPTKNIFQTKLKFGNLSSVLLSDAGNYFGICKSLLDEIVFERTGSF